jgi:hypothetical protein
MGVVGGGRQVDSLQQWILRGFIKEPERAIEKATVCYGGDVSRLLDVCRARALFDGPAGILACLGAIGAPGSGAVVVRVKNSLRPGHDSRLTGGYRVRRHRPLPACGVLARARTHESTPSAFPGDVGA